MNVCFLLVSHFSCLCFSGGLQPFSWYFSFHFHYEWWTHVLPYMILTSIAIASTAEMYQPDNSSSLTDIWTPNFNRYILTLYYTNCAIIGSFEHHFIFDIHILYVSSPDLNGISLFSFLFQLTVKNNFPAFFPALYLLSFTDPHLHILPQVLPHEWVIGVLEQPRPSCRPSQPASASPVKVNNLTPPITCPKLLPPFCLTLTSLYVPVLIQKPKRRVCLPCDKK